MPKTTSPLSLEYALRLTEKFCTTPRHNHISIVTVESLIKVDRLVIHSWIPWDGGVSNLGAARGVGGAQRSVHAFVDKATGELIKSGGWKKPAKRKSGEWQSKYNLNTEMDKAVEDADPYGRYLYL